MAYVAGNDLFFRVIIFVLIRTHKTKDIISVIYAQYKQKFANKVLKEMHQNEKTSIMKVVVGSFM